ncbi:amino acid ABC transporter ATP-binding protein [Candidatus Dependentiae bacterium]|nr:amino acid ABC transporter ATP-binding protein [Candidatus Dependentiae bacterium]
MINITQLTKKRSNKNVQKTVLSNVTCAINSNRITLLVGPSGSGKTTLLRCIAGLEQLDEGSITIQNKPLKELSNAERAGKIGFVFQNYSLFPHLSVLENCIQPLLVTKGIDRQKAVKKALPLLKQLGIETLQDFYPRQLSGGQQQRVALARTLCLEPQAILLDEPTSALDPENTVILSTILQKLTKQNVAIIISSQDVPFIKSIAEKICLLEEGKLMAETDTPYEQLEASSKIARFLL